MSKLYSWDSSLGHIHNDSFFGEGKGANTDDLCPWGAGKSHVCGCVSVCAKSEREREVATHFFELLWETWRARLLCLYMENQGRPQGTPRWWQLKYFISTSTWGKMNPFDEHIFQMGWFKHQLGEHSYLINTEESIVFSVNSWIYPLASPKKTTHHWMLGNPYVPSLKLTAKIAPENGGLED